MHIAGECLRERLTADDHVIPHHQDTEENKNCRDDGPSQRERGISNSTSGTKAPSPYWRMKILRIVSDVEGILQDIP